jgi:hypothetical protein
MIFLSIPPKKREKRRGKKGELSKAGCVTKAENVIVPQTELGAVKENFLLWRGKKKDIRRPIIMSLGYVEKRGMLC